MSEEQNIIFIDRADVGDEKFHQIWGDLNKQGVSPQVYEHIVDLEWYNRLGFCGCGCPEEVMAYIVRILEAMKERSASGWEKNTVLQTITSSDDDTYTVQFYFVMYVLDAMGLTEHGGSVGGSWLTEKGEKFLAQFKVAKP